MRGLILESVVKTYAAFVQNTIRPILDRFAEVLALAKERDIDLHELMDWAADLHFRTLMLQLVTQLFIASILCATCLMILR